MIILIRSWGYTPTPARPCPGGDLSLVFGPRVPAGLVLVYISAGLFHSESRSKSSFWERFCGPASWVGIPFEIVVFWEKVWGPASWVGIPFEIVVFGKGFGAQAKNNTET